MVTTAKEFVFQLLIFLSYRFCLWILGNDATLMNSKSVWRNLIQDAKERSCFYNAEEDKSLAQAIASAKIEFIQLDKPLNNSKWKVMTLHCVFF